MIKIIKEGHLPSEIRYIQTCDYCHTQFTYQQEDITYSLDNFNQEYSTVQCPFCSHTVYLSKNKVPYTEDDC